MSYKQPEALPGITVIVPYYRNPMMLAQQLDEWAKYPPGFDLIVVDDGSPEPAFDVVMKKGWRANSHNRLRVFRIMHDIPWNRGGARNLGAHVTETNWMIQIDIDHVLPIASARALLDVQLNPGQWYRFRRFRQGKADATRRKDKIPEHQTFGEIHPHVDSYLCERSLYWAVGGYDEDYSGCLGGGNPFLRHLEKKVIPKLLPPEVSLHVYTRDAVADASDTTLSRSSEEYSRRRKEKESTGRTMPRDPLRFEWKRVL